MIARNCKCCGKEWQGPNGQLKIATRCFYCRMNCIPHKSCNDYARLPEEDEG